MVSFVGLHSYKNRKNHIGIRNVFHLTMKSKIKPISTINYLYNYLKITLIPEYSKSNTELANSFKNQSTFSISIFKFLRSRL